MKTPSISLDELRLLLSKREVADMLVVYNHKLATSSMADSDEEIFHKLREEVWRKYALELRKKEGVTGGLPL